MRTKVWLGLALILLGAFLFTTRQPVGDVGSFFGYLWPSLFVIPLGIFFHWLHFSMLERRGSGLLIPGGILLVAGVVCQISMLFDVWGYMWPGFILAVAAGLFEFYWFGVRNKWLLIPINILAVLALLFYAVIGLGVFFNGLMMAKPVAALVLIALGALLLLGKKRDSHV